MRRPQMRARVVACLAALAGTAGAVQAQVPVPPEERAPAMLHIGPVELRPHLVVSNVGVDSNVYNESENPRSDFTATIAPDIELAVNPGRLRLTLLSGMEYVYFSEYVDQRSTNRRFGGRAEADLTALRPFIEFNTAHTSARAGQEIDVRARRHPRSVAGGTRVRIGSRSSLVLTMRRAVEDYADSQTFRGVELARTLDSTRTQYEGALAVEVTPLTTVTMAVQRESTRFDQSPLRDADSLLIAPTIAISPLGLVSGTASVGFRRFEGRHSSLPSYTGLSASGTLGMVLADRYKFETSFVRDVRYSYEPAHPYYVQTGGRATVSSYLFGGLDARVIVGREVLDYRPFAGGEEGGRDRVNVYGGGAGYRLTERLQLVVTAEHIRRVSQRDVTRGYESTRVFATLNWGVGSR